MLVTFAFFKKVKAQPIAAKKIKLSLVVGNKEVGAYTQNVYYLNLGNS